MNGTPSCGTVTENRKGFPTLMNGGKVWARKRDMVICAGYERMMSWLCSGLILKL